MRVVIGCIAALFAALVGGLILGEYELRGIAALVAGLLFGLAVGEAAISAGKTNDWALTVAAGASAFVGLTWAAYIDAGNDAGLIAGARWAGSVLAFASAAAWVRTLGSRAAHSRSTPESP